MHEGELLPGILQDCKGGAGKDPTKFSNYRPVSVLSVLSQVFELVLKERLVAFLEREGVVTPEQYVFREGHSTTTAILDMVERVRAM